MNKADKEKNMEMMRQRLRQSGLEGIGLTDSEFKRASRFVKEDSSFTKIAEDEGVTLAAVSVSIHRASWKALGFLTEKDGVQVHPPVDQVMRDFVRQLEKPQDR